MPKNNAQTINLKAIKNCPVGTEVLLHWASDDHLEFGTLYRDDEIEFHQLSEGECRCENPTPLGKESPA